MLEMSRRLWLPVIEQIERVTGRKLFARVRPNAHNFSTALERDRLTVVFDGQGNGPHGAPLHHLQRNTPDLRPEAARVVPKPNNNRRTEDDIEMARGVEGGANDNAPRAADVAEEAANNAEEGENVGAEHDGAEAAGEAPAPNPQSNEEIVAEWQRRIDETTDKLNECISLLDSLDSVWARFWHRTDRAVAESDKGNYERELAVYQGAKSQAELLVQRQNDAYNAIIADIRSNIRATIEEQEQGDDQQRVVAQMFEDVLAEADANDNFIPMLINGISGRSIALNRQIVELKQSLEETSKLIREEHSARVKLETQLETQKIEHDAQIKELNATVETQAVEIQGLNATIETQAVEIQGLNATIETQAVEIQGLNATIETQAVEIQGLNKKIETQAVEMQGLNKKIETQAVEMQGLNKKLEEQGVIIAQLLERDKPAAPAAKKQGVDRSPDENITPDGRWRMGRADSFDAIAEGWDSEAEREDIGMHPDPDDDKLYKAAKEERPLSETALASGSVVPVEKANKSGSPKAAEVITRPVNAGVGAGSMSH
jgi:hypothetical protein